MRYTTPLRYPGGKARLATFVKLIFQANRLLDGHYVEPYAGGAGVALALLFDEYASHIHINDIDPAIHAFWYSVLHETDALCRLVRDTPVNMKQWHKQKAVQANPENAETLELGFSTFFLNRTNRSGIVTGGAIGGLAQTGHWKIDARYNKTELIKRIERIGSFQSRITLYKLDAIDLLRKVVPKLPSKTLLYLDPPYFVKGQQRLYANYYRESDHATVAKLVAKVSKPWIVSYDNAPEIRQLYAGHRQLIYNLNYSAADRYKGSEVMVFSNNLEVPRVTNPAKIPRKYPPEAAAATG